ncbi:RHS repeat-associated core domain-containing protein [Actinoplanes sp. NEAU-A12]|uniref:RHS repeat-associated core domain-containing protein n=1 Tax=Actinoplanes sandaracinus TaxID=3045177 RepID=A0ABT6X1S7_9ACTN|nr:RHS repeat-associated core domain-containing protein [Actinoplanes sandaracinus]MDI6105972.1 RHS repeat-associated core domain-containing protein [Actinoplanes sandaracinus]
MVLALTATLLDVAKPRPAIAAPTTAQQGAEQALERPDEAAALVTARLTGKRVRISGLTSETSEFFALPEGQVEATVAAGVVRVRRDGGWVPVDLTLRPQADGSVAPAAHPLEVKVSGVRAASPSGELASVGTGTDRVALGWQGALPPPLLNGNKATYRDVLPDTDLVVEATRSGFEQFVVAKSPAAVPHLDEVLVPLSGTRVAAVDEDATGSLAVEDSAGRKVASVPTPLMWDAQLAPNGESPARVTQVEVTAEQPKTKSKAKASAKNATPAPAGPATLKLTPDVKWLTDPATKYPVTIDPQINKLLTTFDTTVSERSTADQGGADYLRLGVTTEATPKKSRSFVQWDSSALRGKQITAASAHFYNWYSTTCAQTPWEIWTTDPANADTRWANQPKWLTKEATSTQTKGLNTTCGDGWVSIDAKNFFQRAATGNANRAHMGIRAANEADKSQWKEFRSRNADNTAQVPYAKVTYNSYPTIGARSTLPSVPCVSGGHRPYINTETPQLKAVVSDPDGSKVKASFEWFAIDNAGNVNKIGGTTTGLAASGSTLTAAIPAGVLKNNSSYAWRVMTNDGTVDSAWSSFCDFTVDKDAPGIAPAVTSTAYPAGTWGGAANKAGDFTFNAAGVGDAAAFEYGLDVNPPTQRVNAANLGGTATANIVPGSDGPHTLFVRSVDRAGNRSPVAKYEFQVGAGAVTKPANGDLIAGLTTLEGAGKSDAAGVEYQWRRGDADGWQNVPQAHVALTEGGGAVTWPLPATGGKPARLNWDVARTLNDAEAGPDPLDGPVQLRAVFTGAGAGTSSTVKFNFDRDRASAASQEIGPGSVNLLTGNFTVSDSDVSVDAFGSDLTLSRTYTSRQAGKVDAMFGPGWTSAVVVDEAESPYTALTVTGSLVQVGLPEGDSVGFARDRTTATGATFESELGAEDLTLTYTSAGDRYTLKNVDGTVVTFTRSGDTPAGQYLPTGVDLPGSGQSTTLSWEKVTLDGATVMRPTRMLAPAPAGVDCSNGVVKGCRALNFHYATATTASGAEAGQFGDYTNRLREVTFTAFDPGADKMATVALARYDYDNTGRLRSVWDPRLDYDNGKHLADTYRYDGAGGVLSELRPAGQEPWQLFYSQIPGDPGVGRLHQVKRSALGAGTAVYSLAYQVPTAGNGAPYTLSAELTRRWGQTVHPVEATAVFGPDQIPDGNLSEGKLPSSYERADITYVDANGRKVNTAAPGDYLTATWYDKWGNIVRELGAGNLRRALDAAGNDSAEQEAQAAYELSTLNVYSADGQQLRDTYGPEHEVVTPGPWLRGRQHTATRYDEGAPTDGGPFNLPTTVTTSLSFTDDRGTQEIEPRVTKTGYDWKLRQPTSSTVGPDWPNLTTRTRYNEAGLVVATTAPRGGDSGDTPSTRKTIYYQAGAGSGRGECDNKPHWANLPCRVESGGQSDSGPALPATVTTYDMFNQPVTEVEKAGDTVLRTKRFSYDGAGRIQETAVTGLGTPVPVERNVYDAATGVLVRTQSVVDGKVTGEVVREHDALGRQIGYTDADGNRSTTGYDLLGRVVTTSNGKGTRSYGFDAGNERRGLLTSITDSLAGGTFTARHDADGAVVAETWPNGMTVTHEYDETGTERAINYERPGCGRDDCSVYYDIARNNVHGQKRWTDDPFATQVFSYDPAGRLFYTTVTGRGDGICDIRKYDLDKASNRTKKHTYRSDSSDCLVENPTGSTSYSYDSADRITGGYTYDALGRTTVLPAADTANPNGGNVTLDYHTTDLVKSITQAGRTTNYTLDVTGERIRSWTDTTAGNVTRTHHYDDDTDNPTWTDEGNNTYTTAIAGITDMAGIASNNGINWQISNLHGDITATITNNDAGLTTTSSTDEYGNPADSDKIGQQRYGWLGVKQRAADTPTGIILMGVRLYNPTTGRFLQVDPVYGGSCNAYDYACADPTNKQDITGKWIGIALRGAAAACKLGRSWCARSAKYVGRKSWDGLKYVGRKIQKNNYFRIGKGGGPPQYNLFRFSAGPSKKHWRRLSPRKQWVFRYHVHVDRRYGGWSNWYRGTGRDWWKRW